MAIRSAPRGAQATAHITLTGAVALHAFTHALATIFAPLYLLMQDGLRVDAVWKVTLLVTLYGVVYWILAYPVGLLADRYDRRLLLGLGLLGNAACVALLATTASYPLVLSLCLLAGVFGALFHPTANALIPAHYPASPGTAIGLLGIGSGLGFFAGPALSGYIAQHATFLPNTLAAWQRPPLVLGLAGLLTAILFLLTAKEAEPAARGGLFGAHTTTPKPPLPPGLAPKALLHGFLIALREFAGVGSATLAALYMLQAFGFSKQKTGFILGFAFLAAAFVNPLVVYLTSGPRRLPAHVVILITASLILVTLPFWPPSLVMVPLFSFQTLALASSAVGDAGLTERIDPHIRGRVNGLFLTVVGTTAALSPWVVGFFVDRLGPSANTPLAYLPLFAALSLLILASSSSAWSLSRLGQPLSPTPQAPLAPTDLVPTTPA